MFKVMIMVTRKPGMSRADFVSHYETVHVPLVLRHFPHMLEYRRNYVDLSEAIVSPEGMAPSCDSITEMWFENRAGYHRMTAANDDPVIGPALADDARKFMDISKTTIFFVDERGAAR
jgi:uncharacterized protein (TIGR02118 family)